MKADDCEEILKDCIDLGVKDVAFSGGEPFEWWPFLKDAIYLSVNGTLSTKIYTTGNVDDFRKKLADIRKVGDFTCVFSLFGSTAKYHERITQKNGSFNQTMKGIGMAVDLGLQVEIHFVPFQDNYSQLRPVAILAKDFGVKTVSVLRFVPQGRGCDMKSAPLNRSQNLELKLQVQRLNKQDFVIRTGSPYNFLLLCPASVGNGERLR